MPLVKRVLIVDDHAPLRSTLKEFFERRGFEVDSTGEQGHAESLLAASRYAAAVIDLSLSGPGGREGLELLELTRLVCPATRAVLLTSNAGPRERAEALRRGAAAFLTKPVPLAELLDAIQGTPPAAPRSFEGEP
jgi:DNA-binding NarL/FixJ family response regulator